MPSDLTLVLIAAPGSRHLSEAIVAKALRAVSAPGFGDCGACVRWLSPGEAWEARIVTTASASQLRDAVERAISPQPVDVAVLQSDAARRKTLLCADMESTIIEQEMLDEMADLLGCRAEIEAITKAAMRGEVDFEGSLTRRVALFAGLEIAKLHPLLERITSMPGAETLIATLRANGCKTALVTGGFTIFAEPVAQRLGFDTVIANVLEIENGRLTGRVVPPIVGPEAKAQTLRSLANTHGIEQIQTLAVGDGANDAAMLAAAGLGVAFRAKPMLAAQARASDNGAVIRHGDLTALLYLQGYTRENFAA
ncbi:phosphoserine phosphatase SerB [Hyphomicrobium sp.]|uniref:phosphoserine phosphatase SerB n=1 Tax=Hyphomicrobium sp. TaxID=82 RepID=UPI003F6F09F8